LLLGTVASLPGLLSGMLAGQLTNSDDGGVRGAGARGAA
jgi:hypothetical protein